MATTNKLMTAEELSWLPDDGMRHELVRGELRTMPPSGGDHGPVTLFISIPLGNYILNNDLGTVCGAEHGFTIARDPDTVRAPDFAFVRAERVPLVRRAAGYWVGAPDLVAEVVSANDRWSEVEEKVAEWLAAGVRMVLVIDPRRRVVIVHRPNQPPRRLTEADLLDGEDVVPGWQLPVRELFSRLPSSRG